MFLVTSLFNGGERGGLMTGNNGIPFTPRFISLLLILFLTLSLLPHTVYSTRDNTTTHQSCCDTACSRINTSDCTAESTNGHMVCRDAVDRWPATVSGCNATYYCYNKTVPATRRCNCNGQWEPWHCYEKENFNKALKELTDEPVKGIKRLSDTDWYDEVSLKQRTFLLRKTANEMKTGNRSAVAKKKEFFKEFLNTSKALMLLAQADSELDKEERTSIGVQLLQTLDEFMLASVEPNNETINIEFETSVVTVLGYTEVPSSHIVGVLSEGNCISLPPEVVEPTNSSDTEEVKIVSFLYHNLSQLLPPGDNGTSIVSLIVSSITNCQSCRNSNLKENVVVSLQIENAAEIHANNGTLSCVFFQIENLVDDFPTGEWRTEGCTISVVGDRVNCSCNHLTHFAILLSPGVQVEESDRKALNFMGLMLLPVSLVCLLIVIVTYTTIRSLWSMRNYIHVMLCANLFVAQLVFMIGIDKVGNEWVCSGVAVTLQYLFLVTFMWILMEGVVLYVTLIRVFVENPVWYIVMFTVCCYVVPAVYMMVIVPIGFLVGVEDIPGHTHYLFYDGDQLQACWLNNDTHFVWTFIAPVLVILMTNIVFFVMAVVVIRKHSKRDRKRKATNSIALKHWLKVSVSLTVVMGLTWLGGVLVFRRELIFMAYISTALVAGQGILLFLILIVLSKRVREAYKGVWQRRSGQSKLLTKLSRMVSTSSVSSTNSHYPLVTTGGQLPSKPQTTPTPSVDSASSSSTTGEIPGIETEDVTMTTTRDTCNEPPKEA